MNLQVHAFLVQGLGEIAYSLLRYPRNFVSLAAIQTPDGIPRSHVTAIVGEELSEIVDERKMILKGGDGGEEEEGKDAEILTLIQ